MKFRFEVDGEEVLARDFKTVIEGVTDMRPAFKEAQKVFYEFETDNFQSENATGASGRWKPLSAAYEAQKVAKYGTFALLAGVMIRTQALSDSLTGETGNSIVKIDKQEAAFGTKLPYAKPHQRGGGRLPQRKVIDPSPKQMQKMVRAMGGTLLEKARKTTLTVTAGNYAEVG